MIVAGLIFAAVAALIHIYIFYLESIAWESERARAAFGTGSVEEARTTKFMAFNQGFYNLFLALLAIVGIAAQAAGSSAVGLTLAFAGAASMLAGHRLPCRTSGALERNGYWLCASPFELRTKPVFVLD